MATRSLGTLTLDLIAKIAGFEAGMDKAARKSKSTMDGIQKQVNNAAKAFAAFGTAAVASTVALVRSQINLADATSKTADRLGFTTEELSKLRYAAEMTGVAGNTFDMAMQRMTRRLGEATTGAGEAVKALQELNLDAQALSDAGPAEAFKTIADALSQIPNQSDRVRLAFKFFDSEGVKLVNTISGGRAGIEAFGDELERLGGVIDSKAAKQAEQFNDNLNRFQRTISGTGNELAISLLPALVEFTDLIGERETQESIQSLVKGLADIAIFSARAAKATVELTKFFAESAAAFAHGPAIGDMPRIDREIEQIQSRLATLREQQAEEENSLIARMLNSIATSAAASHGVILETSSAASKEIQALEEELKKLEGLRDLTIELSGPESPTGQPDGTKAPVIDLGARREELKLIAEQEAAQKKLNDLFDSQIDNYRRQLALTGEVTELEKIRYEIESGRLVGINEQRQQELEGLAEQITLMNERNNLEGASMALMQSLRTETEVALDTYTESMSTLNAALREGIVTQEQYADAVRRTKEELDEMLKKANESTDEMSAYAEQAARNMQSAFADFLFDPFEDGLDGMLNNFVKIIRRMAAEMAAAQIFDSIAGLGKSDGGAGGWSGLIASFAGLFDSGGRIGSGQWGIVGERGPELVQGPALITSRQETAKALGGSNVSVGQMVFPNVRTEREAREATGAAARQLSRIAGAGQRYS